MFEAPKVTVIKFAVEDVITASAGGGGDEVTLPEVEF